MPRLLLAGLFLATAAAVLALPDSAPAERRFVVQVRGTDAGYGYFRVCPTADGGATIEGETLLKLLVDGHELVVRSRRTTVLAAGERFPREYRARLSRGDQESEYTCRVEGDRVVEEARLRGTPAKAAFPLATTTGLIDYNAPEHIEIFLRDRLKTSRGFVFGALVPDMMAVLPLTGKVLGSEEVDVDGGKAAGRKVEFAALGMLYRAWVDADGHLVRIEVPSQAFVGMATSRRIEDLHLQAADLARSFSVPLRLGTGVADPAEVARAPGTVRSARFRVHVRVGDNRTDAAVLANSHEGFEPTPPTAPGEAAAGAGEAAATGRGWIEGALSVHPWTRKAGTGGGPATAGPAPDPTELAPFLAPEEAIESAAPEIRERAAALIPDGTSPVEAARLAADWVHAGVRYETQLVSALAAHQGRVGDCLSMARLTIALLRARHVPARVIGGIALGGRRRLGQHHWVEVYGGPDVGWYQIDPTYGQSEGIDAFHLDLWREGTLDGSADNWVELVGWEGTAPK